MNMHFSAEEERALHGLLEEASDDIVVRLDSKGFIIYASHNARDLGIDLSEMLLKPHLSDIAAPQHAQDLARFIAQALAGEAKGASIEFPILACLRDDEQPHTCGPDKCHRWYALSIKLVEASGAVDHSSVYGAVALLRSVEHRHAIENEIVALGRTDPLTGLDNRGALCARLRRAISDGQDLQIVLFAIDGLRALFMQYGQRTVDDIQWSFAQFLESMAGSECELAQLDEERFVVTFTDVRMKQVRSWADEVLQTFAALTLSSASRAPELTASAGLARVERSVDWSLRQAELGLVMARAGGGRKSAFSHPRLRRVRSALPDQTSFDSAVLRPLEKRGSN